MDLTFIHELAIALGLGLLVGIERERQSARVAGVRTFAMITLLGALSGALGEVTGAWLVPVALFVVAALLVTGNIVVLRAGQYDPGMTSEIAALVMFAVGVLVVTGFRVEGFVIAGAVALLLHWKQPLHGVARRLGDEDFHAVMRLVLIGLVILPILPDRAWGPYGVLNPFRIWLMVVLIVGISLAGWIALRWLGPRAGTMTAGALGGLISSTAATVGFARSSRAAGGDPGAAAVMIMLASTVAFLRVLLEILVAAPAHVATVGLPLLVMAAIMGALSLLAWRRRAVHADAPAHAPADLKAAIVFGLLYGGILFLVAATREQFGTRALYGVAALSGLTDLDAITLSSAQLLNAGQLEPAAGWRLILIGALANLLFKGGVVVVLGARALAARIGVLFGVAVAGGAGLLLLWPG
ncbi:MAG: MgtC/SapB family protein [Gemmatimonadetes bacterium]|nr:MgtC/SapB family protein [Gemmatimonadota bacterium]